ncbi:MAG: NAD(+)/NADH kinase [Elusimicrobia bacterium]|nr:NAD(+)/NADH kinase [Elusimicrobiota bacterium]
MKNIFIIANKEKPKAVEFAKKISGWLKKQKTRKQSGEKIAVVLGGDGMMIKSARELAPKNISLFGVNLGKLGFLAETDLKNVFTSVKKIIEGVYKIEERSMLKIEILRNKKIINNFIALNDAVIKNGRTARVINLNLNINNKQVTEITADGLIISTPTGSTAYSLAAAGPIVHPKTQNIIITPIAPHTLSQRPVIIPDNFIIDVRVNSNHNDVILSIDGQIDSVLSVGDIVKIQKYKTPVKLITIGKNDYFEVLRKKLNWGNR